MNDKFKSLKNGKWRNYAYFNLFAERFEALHSDVIEDDIVTRACTRNFLHTNKAVKGEGRVLLHLRITSDLRNYITG